MYNIVYLPIARQDIIEIITYISDFLKSPQAALDLLDWLVRSILRLQDFPYSCKVYQPVKQLTKEYRVMAVKNYLVFYIINDSSKIVEVYRILYARKNLDLQF